MRTKESRFLTKLSDKRFCWKSRSRLVWQSICGKIIEGTSHHDYYCYMTQSDYDGGRLLAVFKSLGEAKRNFLYIDVVKMLDNEDLTMRNSADGCE